MFNGEMDSLIYMPTTPAHVNEKRSLTVEEVLWNTLNIKKKEFKNYGFVYLLETNGVYKIGKAKDVEVRVKSLQTGTPTELKLVHKIETNDYSRLEKFLHDSLDYRRVRGEWFELSEKEVAKICTISDFPTL